MTLINLLELTITTWISGLFILLILSIFQFSFNNAIVYLTHKGNK